MSYSFGIYRDGECIGTLCANPKPPGPQAVDDVLIERTATICGLAPNHPSPCGNWVTIDSPLPTAEEFERWTR
jgi:hypothetical protein